MINRLKQAVRRSSLAAPAADLHGLFTRPTDTLRLWRDARETWREATFARELPPARSDAPTLLVLSMSNTPYNAKTEAMLGFAVRRRGWEVRVLTSRLYRNASRIFRSYGIHDYIDFEEIAVDGAAADGVILAEIEKRAAEQMDFQSVLAWTYRGAWIGPQLLSSVSRQHFDGAPDPRDPKVKAQLLKRLETSLRFVHAAETELSARPPAAILVNEPNYHVLGPFVDIAIARGIPVVHYIQPSRDDALVFKKLTAKTRRIHPNSITPATFDALLSAPWGERQEAQLDEEFAKRYSGVWKVQARNQPDTRQMSTDEVRAHLDIPPERPVAAVFSHVLWDANLFYGEDLFENYGEWFVETVRAAVANPRITWLVKLHPANIWKRKLSGVTDEYGEIRLIRERIGDLPEHVRLLAPDTPVSTHSLFRTISLGVTVRGSVGYELPCFGVPVLTAGTGRYTGFGFTHDHDSREAYLTTLAQAETISPLSPEIVRRARVHAHALLLRRPWSIRSFQTWIDDDVTDPLNQNLRPRSGCLSEGEWGGDLERFADWLAHSDAIDYLEPALDDIAVS